MWFCGVLINKICLQKSHEAFFCSALQLYRKKNGTLNQIKGTLHAHAHTHTHTHTNRLLKKKKKPISRNSKCSVCGTIRKNRSLSGIESLCIIRFLLMVHYPLNLRKIPEKNCYHNHFRWPEVRSRQRDKMWALHCPLLCISYKLYIDVLVRCTVHTCIMVKWWIDSIDCTVLEKNNSSGTKSTAM